MPFFRYFLWTLAVCCLSSGWQAQAQPTEMARSGWKGKSGEFIIEWSATNLKAIRSNDGVTVFDAASEAKKNWSHIVSNAKDAPLKAEFTYRLLSAIGPYLSVEESTYCDCGGAHPSSNTRFVTLNLEHSLPGSPASGVLTAVFAEQAVFGALRSDAVVVKAMGEAKPESLGALLETLQDETAHVKDCDFAFPPELMSSFAFYDVHDDSAAVRLGLPSANQVCRGDVIQLGLTLPISERQAVLLREAKARQSGLLMVDASRKGRSVLTSFKFSQRGSSKQ